MKAVEIDADLLEELEEDVDSPECVVDRIGPIVPWHAGRSNTERIGQRIAHRVPVGGEPQVLTHRTASNDRPGVIVLERQGFLDSGPS